MKPGFKILLVLMAVIVPSAAQAIPAFSKKYEAPCSVCHSTWPRLNDVGSKFKLNGYQMPDSEDGGETGKLSPADNLFLDIGDAWPPISFRLEGGMVIQQPAEGPETKQNDRFFCCVEGNALTVDIGGTAAPNVGYWLSLPWGKESMEQGYLRFVNFFKPGLVNVDIGVMKITDYDVVSAGREWFGSPLLAFHGHPYNNNSRELGLAAPHNDTGLRIYGRPGYERFTYEVGAYTGAHITSSGEDDAEKAYTFMGRMDLDKFAFSLRYWNNKSGKQDLTATTTSGETLTFAANPESPDETLQEFILSLRYRHPYFEVDLTLDRSSFTLGNRKAVGADGESHTYSQEAVNRNAMTAGVIWLINSWMETGVAYGFSNYEDYNRTVDGQTENVKGLGTGMFQWRLEVRPVMNMRIGLELQVDTSESDARVRSGGSSFDPQNKILLQWDMAL